MKNIVSRGETNSWPFLGISSDIARQSNKKVDASGLVELLWIDKTLLA